MKKLILTAAAVLMITATAMADENITVYSNGNEVADKGVIIDGRTMVPVRGVFEYMGYTVDWDADTKTATLTNEKSSTVIALTNGEVSFTVNDREITPDVPQQIVNDRFMLPLRAVGEAIDAEIEWDGDTKTAYIADKVEAEDTVEEFTPVTNTETIGNTTITSEVNVPFIKIEGISSEEIPEDAATEIELN